MGRLTVNQQISLAKVGPELSAGGPLANAESLVAGVSLRRGQGNEKKLIRWVESVSVSVSSGNAFLYVVVAAGVAVPEK